MNKAETKEIWKGIKSKGSTLPSNLSINEQEITNNNAITEQLNRFFSSSGKNLPQLHHNQIYHLIVL